MRRSFYYQPGPGNAWPRLNERKIVKTISLKKVSAVAVASLGFGLLSVAPAQAAALEITSSVVATAPTVATTIATPAAAGSPITATVNFIQAAVSTTAVHSIRSTYSLFDPNNTDVTADATFTSAAAAVGGVTPSNTANVYQFSVAVSATAATKAVGTVVFTPKMGGVYVLKYTTANTTIATDTNTLVTAGTAGSFYVTGSGAKVATSGVGTATIGAQTGGIAEVRFTTAAKGNSAVYNLTSSGVGSIQVVVAGDATDPTTIAGVSAASDYTQGAKITTAASTDMSEVIATVASTVAGTQTLTWTAISSTTGAPTVVATQAITWGAAPTVSAANSTIYKASSTTAPTSTTDATAIVADATAGTQRANILVTVKNSADAALFGQTVAAAISGPGLIAWDDDGTGVGVTSGSVSYTHSSSTNTRYLVVNGNGSGGVATITFSIGTTVLGTETITFYGAVAKYTAAANVVAVPGTATSDAVNVIATDAAGVVVPGATIYAFSSSSTVASVETSDTTATTAVTEANVGTAATYTSAKAIGTAGFTVTPVAATTATSVTITFGDASTLATSTVTTTAVVGIGAIEAATVALTANKTSYAPGEAVTLTLTYRDALGRLTGTNPGTTLVASSSSSVALGGATLPAAGAIATKVGTKTYAVFAPLTGGPVTVTVTSGTDATHLATAARSVASTVTFNVTDGNAALVVMIDALNAKIVALNALIAKIMKKLGVK
jgi:hypothetical protein